MYPSLAFGIVWIAWIVSWGLAAFWRGRTVKGTPLKDSWPYMALTVVGAILFFHTTSRRLQSTMLWHVGLDGAYALVAITAAGFLFTWWARIHLGKLWSGAVTIKESHRVVDTGPFALVRHPIYFGLIVAIIATGIAKANVPALIGLVLLLLGIFVKARLEERVLRRELGPAYEAYAKRVPMLIPFWPM
jgi:protein-S-isoprenylcysteine O-methyltransferase Ste14